MLDKMYMDKLNDIISTDDYMRFHNRFAEEKKDLTNINEKIYIRFIRFIKNIFHKFFIFGE